MKLITNRWVLLTVISAIITFFGVKVLDFATLDAGTQALIYIGVTLLIVIINLFRLQLLYDRPFSPNPFHYIPTTAALARFVITISLSVSFFSGLYSYWPALIYLTYFYFMTSTYDLPAYHKHFFRGFRVVADLILAALIFCYNGGLRNPTWIMFLVPITTMARHYVSWKPYCTTLSAILFVTLVSIFSNSPYITTIDISPILGNMGSNFSSYVSTPSAMTNWENFKLLLIANIMMILTTLIFLAETKNRLRNVFTFAGNFFEFVLKNSKKITANMLNYLCVSLNVEAIIVIVDKPDKPNEIQFTFQNRNEAGDHNSRCSYKSINEMDPNQEKAFIEWWAKAMEFIKQQQAYYKKQGPVRRWFLKDNTSTLDSGDIPQLYSHTAPALFSEFSSIFLKPDSEMMKIRTIANLYKKMDLVSIVPFKVGNSNFIILNDLPTKFRIVPRPFWDDGIQKIHMTKFILD
ncbi:MAG: hypothetical protein HZB59_03900 [Ignavibacteriales bacterium]|nr:hypothetical protein [Ignavibacteriales bacterium]